MKVYLADLGHDQLTISSDVYPLGIAGLATYLEAYREFPEKLEVRLFRSPARLRTALDDDPPDVLGLSSYAWNHNLALQFARYAKSLSAATLTVLGGPNFPLTRAEQESYLRGLTDIDVASRGPTYESERAFLHLVNRFARVGKSIEGLQAEPVPANAWIDRRSGEFVHGEEVPRIMDLDEIPSPYRQGLMDQFLDSGLFPLLQIARGCPFTCTFCNSATSENSRIFAHSIDYMQKDLVYLAERVAPETALCLADDNFGMYPRDEEIADFIGRLQDRYGWPNYIRTTTGKNRGDRIIRVMRKARGALPMTSAVQSLNPEVLKNIKRDNISLDTYAEIQQEVVGQGMQAYGELILGLPGETKESFLEAVDQLLETGVKRVSAHQLMLLHGAPLSNPDEREKFGFETRFRVVARNIGHYLEDPVVETEEIVVATPDLSFDDYLECRVFHLLLTIFFYEGNFEEVFAWARQHGLRPFRAIREIQSRLDSAPEGFAGMIDAFIEESKSELFDTEEECIRSSLEHFDELVSGELGGNLLSKYSMLGRFFHTQEALGFLRDGIAAALAGTIDEATLAQLDDVVGYLKAVSLDSPFRRSLDSRPTWETRFDVEGWREEEYTRDLADFEMAESRRFATVMDPGKAAVIEQRIEAFGDNPSGLGKFTRSMFARDLRRSLEPLDRSPD